MLVKASSIILDGEGYPLGFLHQLDINVCGLRMLERIIDQLVEATIDQCLCLLRQPAFITEIMELYARDSLAEIS